MMQAVRDVKICLLGDTLVGKTSIVQRYVYDTFNPAMDRTIGAAFFSKSMSINDVTFRYQIWDTAGQEKYKALAPMYYRDAAAAVVVFDITSPETFMSVKIWISELRRLAEPAVVVVVGNKLDLDEQRKVDIAEAEAFTANHGCLYVETSAKDSVNISQLFTVIGRSLLTQPTKKDSEAGTLHEPLSLEKSKKSSCCNRT